MLRWFRRQWCGLCSTLTVRLKVHALQKSIEAPVESSHRCCAERNLLRALCRDAQRHGVRQDQAVAWVRRKHGTHMLVWRVRGDGSLGASFPCPLCRAELVRFGLHVTAVTRDLDWYHGHLASAGNSAPASQPTSSQARTIFRAAVC